jgi:hypothetical protein
MKTNLIKDVNDIKSAQLMVLSIEEIIIINGGDTFLRDFGRAVGDFLGFMHTNAGTIRPSEYR